MAKPIEPWMEEAAAEICNEVGCCDELPRQIIVAILQRHAPGWIAVSERLPEVGESVLVAWITRHGRYAVEEAQYSDDEDTELWRLVRADSRDDVIDLAGEVTHWRELPAPPEGSADKS